MSLVTQNNSDESSQLIIKYVSDIDLAVAELLTIVDLTGFVAIDTEYNSSENNGCVLIQIAVLDDDKTEHKNNKVYTIVPNNEKAKRHTTVYVLNVAGLQNLPLSLGKLFSAPKIVKIFCDFGADERRLNYYQKFNILRVVDIQDIAFSIGYQKTSLEYISEKLCGLSKLKTPKISHLGYVETKEIIYSAYDAYLTLECYLQLIGYDKHHESSVKNLRPTLLQSHQFEIWLKEYVLIPERASNPPTLESIIKIAQNSYSELKNDYTRKENLVMLNGMIENLVAVKNILLVPEPISGTSLVILPSWAKDNSLPEPAKIKISSEEEVPTLVDDREVFQAYNRTKIQIPQNGIKMSSYVRCLMNSNWLNKNYKERETSAIIVINRLIALDVFSTAGGKLFNKQ